VIFLSGCGSLGFYDSSPLTKERGKAPDKVKLDDFLPSWQPFAGNSSGLFYASASIIEPKLELRAIKANLSVDLSADLSRDESQTSLKIVVNSRGGGEGKLPSIKVSSFVRNYGLLAGINATPFDITSSKEGEERNCAGIVVSDGITISQPFDRYDAIVFYKDGSAAILPQAEITSLEDVENAVGGFRMVLKDGELAERLSRTKEVRHPRSAVGLSSDGRTLYLLVIDGRRSGSIGATEAEIALIMKKLGAECALNLDGGGSTAMALRLPNNRVKIVNTPIHKGIPGRERAVGACIGLAAVENHKIVR